MKTARKILPFYMIIGSLLGFYTSVNFVAEAAADHPEFIWGGLVFGFIYILTGISGLLLIKSNKTPWHTVVLQAIQVFSFSVLSYKYRFCSGVSFVAGFNFDLNQLYYTFEPISIEFTMGKNISNTFFEINFAPIIVILILFTIYDE